jgi:thiamine biosynthesis lipoprotein
LLDTGEFISIGSKAGHPWLVGVQDPRNANQLATLLGMDGRSVATSGDYETFFTADFAHNHIFDPATGDSPPELASVTVAAPTGLLADGLSTAFFVMGHEKSLRLIQSMPQVDALFIDKNGRAYSSAGLGALART